LIFYCTASGYSRC